MNDFKKYLLHLFILVAIQILILNNIHLGSYFYINIYILAIYLLPYRVKGVALLLFGFFLGFGMDLVDNTIGIHAAASTFIAYIRPRLLLLTSNREAIDEIHSFIRIGDISRFMKYAFLSTLSFNIVLIFAEAFTFNNILITLLRIFLSTFISFMLILFYYFIGLKKVPR